MDTRQLLEQARALAQLVLELAEAVDNAAADIGGSRPQLDILREAVQAAVKVQNQPGTSTPGFLTHGDTSEAWAAAMDLDHEVMEIANGKRKVGKLSLEKLAIVLSFVRERATPQQPKEPT